MPEPEYKIEYVNDNVGQKRKTLEMPYTVLKEKHVKNTKIILNRAELLRSLTIQDGIFAEIGVARGDFSQKIFEICKPKKLHLIDMWSSERYSKECEASVLSRFSDEIANKKVVINRGKSVDVLSEFPNEYFDWVYIDTVHDYKVTSQELEICRHKVKKGGIIAGHDFVLGNWNSSIKYGVIEAVYEFCGMNNWEFIALTMELNGNSFAVREIQTN